MKIAVIGSGISGLAVAHGLHPHCQVTLLEANDYFGGHTHTVDITVQDQGRPITFGVDTGFLVLNERTYPNLLKLFSELQVDIAKSDMSFSVQVPQADGSEGLEWSGNNLSTVFAQRRNLLNPKFLGMLQDLLRFNRLCTELAESGKEEALKQPLADFLDQHKLGTPFREWYFLPMLGCIWSCPTDQMLQFPVATMIRFCHNHGLLQVNNRPQWFTVRGGARNYVNKVVAQLHDARLNSPVSLIERHANGVWVHTPNGPEPFDHVVIATHTDQALTMLDRPSAMENNVLAQIGYQPNLAVLHTDASLLPKRRSAWASWNYERATDASQEHQRVCLHYWLNQLQPLPTQVPIVETLNPIRAIDPAKILASFDYSHPVFDLKAIQAQALVPLLQGQNRTWYAGAWTGYGFHEDGLKSGQLVTQGLLQKLNEANLKAAA